MSTALTPNTVLAPRSTASAAPSNAVRIDGAGRRFICRGCYFIYEEANGLPQESIRPGTPFATLPSSWRCPDCGTDKATFRPYIEILASG